MASLSDPVIILFKNPLDPNDREIIRVKEGTIFFEWLYANYPQGFGRPIKLMHNGRPLEVEESDVPLSEQDVVTILVEPAAFLLPALITALISAAISIAVTLVVSLIFGKPKGINPAPDPDSVYTLQGGANQARLGSPIPVIYGSVITYPDYVCPPYSWYEGNDNYIGQVLCLGHGEFDIHDILISDTPVSTLFGNAVEWHVFGPNDHNQVQGHIESKTGISETILTSMEVTDIDLSGDSNTKSWTSSYINGNFVAPNKFVADGVLPSGIVLGQTTINSFESEFNRATYTVVGVSGSTLTLALPAGVVAITNENDVSAKIFIQVTSTGILAGPFVTCLPGQVGDRIDLDFVMPSGHYNVDKNTGKLHPANISFEVRVQQIDDAGNDLGFYTEFNPNWTAKTNTPKRYTASYAVPPGRYKVTVERLTPPPPNSYQVTTCSWAGLKFRLIPTADPVYGNTTLLAIKLRATGGVSLDAANNIRVRCTRKLPVLGSGELVASRSPADAFVDALTNPIYGARRSLNSIDLETLEELSVYWGEEGVFNGAFTTRVTIWEALSVLLQTVAATPAQIGALTTVVQDGKRAISTQMFTSANIKAGSFTISYTFDRPGDFEGYQVEYRDPDSFKQAYVVYPPDAVDFESVVLVGCTDQAIAMKHAVLLWNRRLYRRKQIQFSTEMEGALPRIGDKISVANDLVEWGQSAEVVRYDDISRTVTFDRAIDWSALSSPVVAFRNEIGAPLENIVISEGAIANQGVLATTPPVTLFGYDSGQQPTICALGETTTVVRFLTVADIKFEGQRETAISCINYDERVWVGALDFQQFPSDAPPDDGGIIMTLADFDFEHADYKYNGLAADVDLYLKGEYRQSTGSPSESDFVVSANVTTDVGLQRQRTGNGVQAYYVIHVRPLLLDVLSDLRKFSVIIDIFEDVNLDSITSSLQPNGTATVAVGLADDSIQLGAYTQYYQVSAAAVTAFGTAGGSAPHIIQSYSDDDGISNLNGDPVSWGDERVAMTFDLDANTISMSSNGNSVVQHLAPFAITSFTVLEVLVRASASAGGTGNAVLKRVRFLSGVEDEDLPGLSAL